MYTFEQWTGVEHRAIRKALADAGLTPLSKKGRSIFYDSAAALRAILSPTGVLSPSERLADVRRQLVELELRKRREELFEGADVLALRTKHNSAARARFRAIPSKIAGQIAPPGKIQQAEALIRAAIDEALAELAGDGDRVTG